MHRLHPSWEPYKHTLSYKIAMMSKTGLSVEACRIEYELHRKREREFVKRLLA